MRERVGEWNKGRKRVLMTTSRVNALGFVRRLMAVFSLSLSGIAVGLDILDGVMMSKRRIVESGHAEGEKRGVRD